MFFKFKCAREQSGCRKVFELLTFTTFEIKTIIQLSLNNKKMHTLQITANIITYIVDFIGLTYKRLLKTKECDFRVH